MVHANWTRHSLHLWAEDCDLARDIVSSSASAIGDAHPFAAPSSVLLDALIHKAGVQSADFTPSVFRLALPCQVGAGSHTPLPSARVSALLDRMVDDEALATTVVDVQSLEVSPRATLRVLIALGAFAAREHENPSDDSPLLLGHDIAWWIELSQLGGDLLVHQRFVPTLLQHASGTFEARWNPWLTDTESAERFHAIVAAMPAVVRATDDAPRDGRESWTIADSALSSMIDGFIRCTLSAESYVDSLDGRDPDADVHVAWLSGLLDGVVQVKQPASVDSSLMRSARTWLSRLDEPRDTPGARLKMVLEEPEGDELPWMVRFQLVDQGGVLIADASSIWGSNSTRGRRRSNDGENLGETLLSELARAAYVWPTLEQALEESEPESLELDAKAAHNFLTEIYPLLVESGFSVEVPEWWGQESSRIGARLLLSPGGGRGVVEGASPLGLSALVQYEWRLSVGDAPLDIAEFERLVSQKVPLVKVGGKWIEIRADDLKGALTFLREHPGGTMTLIEALRLASGVDGPGIGIPITGFDASGWIGEVFGANATAEHLTSVQQPAGFLGELRPYQRVGLSWLAFLNNHDIGACLADDMGLGKTIQLIALLQHERAHPRVATPPGQTLLVAPLSVLGNWKRELHRFAPELRVHVQHGLDRPSGDRLKRAIEEHDVILTTYAIAVRDRDAFGLVSWERIVLDEAQHIKNPPTKQTAAIRSLTARHRVALTGTPVENRLAELWSIMEFCCPSYLGSRGDFQRNFAIPVERFRDAAKTDRLRALVRPFILRRLKTDPKVIDDLPPLVETKEYVGLTEEQVRLYTTVVDDMLAKVDSSSGIQRRGLILSSLVKLKQICNHPAHFLAEGALSGVANLDDDTSDAMGEPNALPSTSLVAAIARSGKMRRLMELLEEVIANGHRALLFTQYRQMGHLLAPALARHFDIDPIFLHGGTPQQKRDELVDRFQSGDPRCPVFLLSLRAGGTGLNLTSANHVFHYDRWWNPAVENQATDRAFRIGQTRKVHVHKFVVEGSLEERIDQMIELKSELATSVIGSGDAWLTELDTHQLRDLLLLRTSGAEDES